MTREKALWEAIYDRPEVLWRAILNKPRALKVNFQRPEVWVNIATRNFGIAEYRYPVFVIASLILPALRYLVGVRGRPRGRDTWMAFGSSR